jgi:hypothetical protein
MTSEMDANSTAGLAVGLFLVLFFAYLYLESRESDARGVKQFSPQKLGKVLKKTFGICLPDCILLQFANFFIFCGFVGNSCMENIHSDEDIREAKKMARLAATLGRSGKSSKSSKKRSKHRKDGRGRHEEDDAEEALFSGGDNDSDISDLENGGGSVDSGHRSSRRSKSKSRHRSDEIVKSEVEMQRTTGLDQSDSGVSFKELTHSRRKPEVVSVSPPLEDYSSTKNDRRDSRLNLSQHSTASRSNVVSRESLQALIAAEDMALGRGAKV